MREGGGFGGGYGGDDRGRGGFGGGDDGFRRGGEGRNCLCFLVAWNLIFDPIRFWRRWLWRWGRRWLWRWR